MKIVFATNNQHKLQEIRDILGSDYEVVSLKEIGCDVDIPETGNTLEENALQKAQYIYDHYHISCFADDTGLEVEALDGAPGVHSARYAEGTDHDSEANMAKLLRELAGKENRQARFRTVICYIEKQDVCPCGCTSIKKVHQFEGIVNGRIATEKHGTEGFGYDPIFVPEGYNESFAQLGMDIKKAKRAGLLHDIGKAVDHEVEGPHALIGADLAKKYNESKEILHAIAAHHEDQRPETALAVLVQAADSLSGARPGARKELLESYVKRLEDLENIASEFDGVSKAYAIQAGREIRVMVNSENVDDDQTYMLCKGITGKIEENLTYPGQIRVTVIRERRAVGYAK